MVSEKRNEVAELATKYVNSTDRNIFLTGKAGTGKTTFLKHIVANTFKNAVVAAPTGIAAINAGGVTLHSLFHLPFGSFLPDINAGVLQDYNIKLTTPKSLISGLKINATKRQLIREMELLIIDEVSMLRADLLDAIDHVLRHVRRKKNEAFGGLQVLFIGDLLQLPPVVNHEEWQLLKDHYPSIYFFDALILRKDPPVYIELEEVYRQSEQSFVDLLNRFRTDTVTRHDYELLNSKYAEDFTPEAGEGYVHITTHNQKADRINQLKLDQLAEKPFEFHAIISGEFEPHQYPNQDVLTLKNGAQVMFIKNDISGQQRYFNGKIGTISHISADSISVTCGDREEIELERYKWENKKYRLETRTNEINESVTGTFEQFPIRLAWAITVHKSQGLTFDKAILDLSRTFAPGQMYVALSRLTSMDGLVLSSPLPEVEFESNSSVRSFTGQKKELSVLEEMLGGEARDFHLLYTTAAYDFNELVRAAHYHLDGYEKKTAKFQHVEWARSLQAEILPLKEVGDKFIRQLRQIVASSGDNYLPLLSDRLHKAKSYFEPLLDQLISSVSRHISGVKSAKRIKGYLKELEELENSIYKNKQSIHKAFMVVDAALNNRVLNKNELVSSPLYVARNEMIRKSKKEVKIPTKEISYKLYKSGKSVEQVAEERNLTEGTIQGHLAQYVAFGDLDVKDFINDEKLNNILTVSSKLETHQFGPIKGKLGDEYTYADIRFAIAYLKSLEET